ncbi:hypothetical protein Hanom_Chr01g00031831 [Helianthus anomalus]
MAIIAKRPEESSDLSAQPAAGTGELSNLGIGPEKRKRAPTTSAASKKNEADKAQTSKAKNAGVEKKGTHRSSDSWCDYVVVHDSLEDLAPVVIRRPKPEPKNTADIPPSNPHDPIDLESSPERLVRKKAGKRKQTDVGEKLVSPVPTEPSIVANEEVPPSPPRASVAEQLKNIETPEAGDAAGTKNLEVDMPTDVAVSAEKVTSPEIVDGAGNPQTLEPVSHGLKKGKTVEDIPVTTSPSKASGFMPENIDKVTVEDQGSFSDAGKNSPIRPDETLGDYYYRTYSEKDASETHVLVWNLKKGNISAWGN